MYVRPMQCAGTIHSKLYRLFHNNKLWSESYLSGWRNGRSQKYDCLCARAWAKMDTCVCVCVEWLSWLTHSRFLCWGRWWCVASLHCEGSATNSWLPSKSVADSSMRYFALIVYQVYREILWLLAKRWYTVCKVMSGDGSISARHQLYLTCFLQRPHVRCVNIFVAILQTGKVWWCWCWHSEVIRSLFSILHKEGIRLNIKILHMCARLGEMWKLYIVVTLRLVKGKEVYFYNV